MQFSYWEIKSWLSDIDYCVIGSGIVGLSTALHLKTRQPDANIIILEKGLLPQGASTKNAGFACFGSLSEMILDRAALGDAALIALVERRRSGLQLLRTTLGDSQMGYIQHGGYELFLEKDKTLYEKCLDHMEDINALLYSSIGGQVFHQSENTFGFKAIEENMIYNPYEGQIDTGKMMSALLQKVQQIGVKILNGITVTEVESASDYVAITTEQFDLKADKVCICTNGFAAKLIDGIDITPARAQVLITKPIDNLKIKGTFHFDEGYYYFRNVGNRILLGGARNEDITGETTYQMELSDIIQAKLDQVLGEVILPDYIYSIDHQWTGIMGMGTIKEPIVNELDERICYGIRLSGMGIAIGSQIGKELAEMIS